MRSSAMLFAVLLAVAPVAAAAPVSQAGEELARMLDAGSREASVGVRGDVAYVSIARENRTGADALRFAVDFQRGELLLIEMDQDVGEPASVEVRFGNAFVFEDANGDGRYDAATETLLAGQSVRSLAWEVAPRMVAPAAPAGHVPSATAELGNGTMRLNATLVGSYAVPEATDFDVGSFHLGLALDEVPDDWRNATFALTASASQRGDVANVPPDEPFPWPSTATVEGAARPVEVLGDAPAASTGERVRHEVVQLTVRLGDPAPLAPDGDVVGPEWAECALFFRCG